MLWMVKWEILISLVDKCHWSSGCSSTGPPSWSTAWYVFVTREVSATLSKMYFFLCDLWQANITAITSTTTIDITVTRVTINTMVAIAPSESWELSSTTEVVGSRCKMVLDMELSVAARCVYFQSLQWTQLMHLSKNYNKIIIIYLILWNSTKWKLCT